MSGQQEPRGELDRFDRLDPRDSTLDLSGLISRLNSRSQNNGSLSNGNNDRGNGVTDNGVGLSGVGISNSGGANGHRAAPEAAVEPDGAIDGDVTAQADVTTEPAKSGAMTLPEPSVPSHPVAHAEPVTQAGPVTQAVRAERPVPGSLADLRQRLERLPFGHPSSPYHVDGERKPPPYRLKHLELAPPAPSRITQAQSRPPIVEDDPIAAVAPDLPIAATTSGQALNGSQISGPSALTQDQLRIADDAYDRFRAAEGRNLFGSYGSTGLTVVLRDLAASLEYGELAPDTDQNALLEPDAFRARFAGMLARYPDRTADLLARRIPGAISYSFIFDAGRYSAGTWMVQDALAAAGYQMLARRNDWNSAANRCVATMWHDPASGLPFEVQFHTTASLEAQQLARSSASLISDPRIPSGEAANLKSDLAAAWSALPAPPGHGQIGDYRRDGGSRAPGIRQPGDQLPGEVASG